MAVGVRCPPHAREALAVDSLAAVVEMVRAGLFAAPACRAVGVAPGTLRYWRRKRGRGEPMGERLGCLLDELDRIEARVEIDLLARLREGGPGWRAAAWMLERRFPARWGSGKRRASGEGAESEASPDAPRIIVGLRDATGPSEAERSTVG